MERRYFWFQIYLWVLTEDITKGDVKVIPIIRKRLVRVSLLSNRIPRDLREGWDYILMKQAEVFQVGVWESRVLIPIRMSFDHRLSRRPCFVETISESVYIQFINSIISVIYSATRIIDVSGGLAYRLKSV